MVFLQEKNDLVRVIPKNTSITYVNIREAEMDYRVCRNFVEDDTVINNVTFIGQEIGEQIRLKVQEVFLFYYFNFYM